MLADLFDTGRPPALELLVSAILRTPMLWSSADTGAGNRDWVPPELRVFGRTGVDNGVFGVVFHCPEAPVPTWPIATYYLGGGTESVHPTCAAGVLAFLETWNRGDAELRRRVARAERPAMLPKGYTVEPTMDGLGLVVPSAVWAADDGPKHRLEQAADVVQDLVQSGRAGSALHVGRDALALVWRRGRQDLVVPLNASVAMAYDALDRPEFARIARERAGLASRASRPTATATLPVDVAALVGDSLAVAWSGTATLRADGPIQGQVMLTLRADVVLESGDDATVLLIQGWSGDGVHEPLNGRVDAPTGRVPLAGLRGSLVPLARHLPVFHAR